MLGWFRLRVIWECASMQGACQMRRLHWVLYKKGLGKLRHVRVQYLWLQSQVRSQHVRVDRVTGSSNPADMMTKSVSGQ